MSLTAEHLLAGAMLLDADVRQMVADRGLGADDFGDRLCLGIVAAMAALTEQAAPIDAVTVARQASRQGDAVAAEQITALMQQVVTVGDIAHAPYYADVVAEESRIRALWAAVDRVAGRIRTDPAYDYRSELLTALDALQHAHRPTTLEWYETMVPRYIADLEALWAGKVASPAVATGWPSLDRMLRGGCYPGELTIIGARPGIGKTVMGLELAHAAARAGKRVIFFSAEMTKRALMERAGSEFTSIPAALITQPGAAKHEEHTAKRRHYVKQLMEQMAALPIAVDERSRPTVAYMREQVERIGDVGLVIFDYLGLAGETVKGDSEERRISQIAGGLMHLAKTCNVPVVALSQLSREVERHAPYIPTLAHLRYSGDVEANAHVVLLLYRRDYYVDQGMLQDDEGKRNHLDIYVAKHRNGETGLVTLRFDGPTFSIQEFAQ